MLQDLCARLPYGVRMKGVNEDFELSTSASPKRLSYVLSSVAFRPYLRSLSTMTEDEKQELLQLMVGKRDAKFFQVNAIGITNTDSDVQVGSNWIYHYMNFSFENITLCYDYLISRFFDVFGLIPLDLAYEAPEGMYNTQYYVKKKL